MHYVIRTNLDEPNLVVRATVMSMDALKGKRLTTGASFGNTFPRLELQLDQEGEAADFFESGPLLIISDKMKDILNGLGCAVELNDVDLIDVDGIPSKMAYYVVNILDSVECLDYEHSVYEMDEDYIDQIDTLVIDEEKAGNTHLLRLKNSYDNIILASEELMKLCRGARVTGVQFVSPKDWKW